MLLAKDSDKSYNYYENLDNSQQDEYNIVLKANKGDKLALEYIISKYKNFVKAKAKSYFLVGADNIKQLEILTELRQTLLNVLQKFV